MLPLLLLSLLLAAASGQYTLYLSQTFNPLCAAPLTVLPMTSLCNSFTSSTGTFWSWRFAAVVTDPNVILVSWCQGTLNCASAACTATNMVLGTCIQWGTGSARIEAGNLINGTTSMASSTTAAETTTPAPGSGSGGKCFHESTQILYGNGERLTMHNPGPCRVPHVISDTGHIIRAGDFMLRVTSAHLLYSGRGLVRADQLRAYEDVLFGDLAQKHPLAVRSVERESEPQTYFGLNCPQGSVVLANGIKSSTFETLHTLPALWMRTMSALFGIERASRWGDTLAGWGHAVGLLV